MLIGSKRRSLLVPKKALLLPTTWDPNVNLGSGISLSNNNLTASNPSTTANAFVQTTKSYSSGKKYCEIAWTGVSGPTSWIFGLTGTHNVVAQKSTNWFVNSVNSGVNTTDLNTTITIAAIAIDFDNSRAWIKSQLNTLWNNNGAADPATNVGGADFSAANGSPYFAIVILQDQVGEIATANFGTTPGAASIGNGTWTFTPPGTAGLYTNW